MDFTREQAKEMLIREIELTQEIEAIKEMLAKYEEIFLQGAKYLESLVKEEALQSNAVIVFEATDFRRCADIEEIIAKCSLLKEKQEELAGLQVWLRTVRSKK